jgi:hypothetical protein
MLPTTDFADIGLPGTIADIGLLEDIPPCYRYNQRTKKVTGWQQGFEDGGPLASRRQFPVMYFDGLQFPEKSAVGWTAAKDLKSFDAGDPNIRLIPHYKAVLAFLRKRSAARDTEGHYEEVPAVSVDQIDSRLSKCS